MTRTLSIGILIALTSHALGQPGGLSKVVYIDKKSGRVKSEEGEVREAISGVKVLLDGKEKLSLTPAEIVRIEYADLPGLSGDDRGQLIGLETEKDPVKARAGFSLLRRKASGDRSRKYLEFRELQAGVRVADALGFGPEHAREAAAVADGWAAFARTYPAGWEVWPAGTARARLWSDAGDNAKAAEAWDGLAKSAGLPAELKREAALARCAVMLRGRLPGAAAAVDDVIRDSGLPADGPQRERAGIYRAWAEAPSPTDAKATPDATAAKVQTALDAAKDPAARAAGFHARGELFLAFRKPQDARWEFLWVETVYFQDREELARALRRLADVWDALGEKDRADQYRDKWKKLRG